MGTAVTRSLGEKAQQLVVSLDSALELLDQKQKLVRDTEAKALGIWDSLLGAASRSGVLVAVQSVPTSCAVPQSEVQTALNAAMRRIGNHRDVVEAGVDALVLWERIQPALQYDRDCREQLPQIEADLLTGDPASVKRALDTLRLLVERNQSFHSESSKVESDWRRFQELAGRSYSSPRLKGWAASAQAEVAHCDAQLRSGNPQLVQDARIRISRGLAAHAATLQGIEQQIAAHLSVLRDRENAARSGSTVVESSAQELARLQSKRRSSTLVSALVSMIAALPIGCGYSFVAGLSSFESWASNLLGGVVVSGALCAVAGGTLAFLVRTFSVSSGERKILEAQQEYSQLAAMLSQAQTEHRALEASLQEGRR